MQYKIEDRPMASVLEITMKPGEVVYAQPSAMMLMSGDLEIKSSIHGGLMKGLLRKALGGETLFINTFKAKSDASVWFVPSFPGDIAYIPVKGTIYMMDGAYLAHHGNLDLGVAWKGVRGFLAGGGGFVWLKVSGNGGVWINGFGGLKVIQLDAGQKITVDNYHIAAIESTVGWKIKTFGGLKTFFFGGEFFVMELTGPGKVYLQSRTIPSFAQVIFSLVPRK